MKHKQRHVPENTARTPKVFSLFKVFPFHIITEFYPLEYEWGVKLPLCTALPTDKRINDSQLHSGDRSINRCSSPVFILGIIQVSQLWIDSLLLPTAADPVLHLYDYLCWEQHGSSRMKDPCSKEQLYFIALGAPKSSLDLGKEATMHSRAVQSAQPCLEQCVGRGLQLTANEVSRRLPKYEQIFVRGLDRTKSFTGDVGLHLIFLLPPQPFPD